MLFLAVLVVAGLAGLGYVFSRPPVYDSTASLIIKPPAGDPAAAAPGLHQHALLAPAFLKRLLPDLPHGAPVSVAGLGAMLRVEVPPQSSALALTAEGPVPDVLPAILDAWIGRYREELTASQGRDTAGATRELEDELAGLSARIESQRQGLDAFRAEHDIVSMERDENRILARLKGLSAALDRADEAEAAAAAELRTLHQAIALGKPVGPPRDERELSNLQARATDLGEQLRQLESVYTQRYLELDPKAQALRERLTLIEGQMARRRSAISQGAVAETEHELAMAREQRDALTQELQAQKKLAGNFQTRFAEHEALREELAQLEQMYRDTQQRLVEFQVAEAAQHPRVELLEPPSQPESPVRPDYWRDAGVVVAGALLLALLTVIGHDFLLGRERRRRGGGSPVFVAVGSGSAGAGLTAPTSGPELPAAPVAPALDQPPARELSALELQALLASGDDTARELIGMLLCGLDVPDIVSLRWRDVDPLDGTLTVQGERGRTLPVPPALMALWQVRRPADPAAGELLWGGGARHPTAEPHLDTILSCVATDAGLEQPEDVNCAAVRHSYIAYLVRQGARLSELPRVLGTLNPGELRACRRLAPSGTKLPMTQIDPLHPSLAQVGSRLA
jgi:uncharacterized protein involved in exopolysaccharide biosynthesis